MVVGRRRRDAPPPAFPQRPGVHRMSVQDPQACVVAGRVSRLAGQVREVFEDVAGFDIQQEDDGANFIELGLDSLMLTQVALQLQKTFAVKITFRQLMGECASLERLVAALDAQLPPEQAQPAVQPVAAAPAPAPAAAVQVPVAAPAITAVAAPAPLPPVFMPPTARPAGDAGAVRTLIAQQMQLMSQQLALLAAAPAAPIAAAASVAAPPASVALQPAPQSAQPDLPATPPAQALQVPAAAPEPANDEEAALAHTRYDVKKAFGAIARIDASGGTELEPQQRARLDAFVERYLARTPKSKAYTQQHRAHMADPRVVTGFRPLTKEIVYQIVVERSKGARVWDIDGNEYVDALNGFGTSLFGWQPEFVVDAVKAQVDVGYEIGPMHPLAGEVSQLVCELTGHDRAALCNTGSE